MINKEKSFVSVVFYVRNFELYIEKFISSVMKVIGENFEHYEFICVNNDSTDKTIDILKKVHNEKFSDVSLNIISLSYCKSIEEAMASGLDLAIGDFVYEFESIILDYETNLIIEAYKKSLEGNDVVFVSPNKKVTIIQKIYYNIYNFGVKKDQKIYPERFKIFSRRAINRVGKMSKYFSNNTSVLNTCGLDNSTIFYNASKKYIKYDKEEKRERISKGLESLLIHTYSIQYFLIVMSFIFFLATVMTLFLKNTTLFACFFICFICVILTLLLVQYIHTLLNMTFKNKVHLIKNIEKVVR